MRKTKITILDLAIAKEEGLLFSDAEHAREIKWLKFQLEIAYETIERQKLRVHNQRLEIARLLGVKRA